jgi:5-carboxymethyl-2-hydroxymuconate isomerase
MPHIIIEHSDNVEVQQAMAALHDYVSHCGLFSPHAVKARSLAFKEYMLVEGAASFVHITIAILDGRTEQERIECADGAFAVAKTHLPSVDKLSLELREMNTQTYRK